MSKLFKIVFRNKKILPVLLGVVIIFSLIPSSSAQAGVWENIAASLSLVPDVLASIPLWLLFGPTLMGAFICSMIVPLIGYVYLSISAGLLNWVTSDYFISMPLTRGGIVDIGLSKTTALVNILFVLVLVFIALSTILRLENYGMKKLLPKFLLVVILINFASVICGVVIDIAKVVTNTFLQPDLGTIFLRVYLSNTPIGGLITNIQNVSLSISSGADLATNVEKIVRIVTPFFTLSGIVGTVLQALTATLFLFFAATEIMLFVLLFMMRIIVIWLLVILAPIAWFCWILPDFKSVYQSWEKYFVQWAFVGAIAGFFLWLQTQLAGGLGEIFNCTCVGSSCTGSSCIQITDSWGGIIAAPFINIINQLFIFGAVIAISFIGFIITLKTSGGGTESVLQWGKKGLDKVGSGVGAIAKRRIAGPALGKAAEGMSKAANWGERNANSSKFTWGGKERATPWAAAAKWATKGAETLFAPTLTEYAAGARKSSTPDNWKQMTIDDKANVINATMEDDKKLTYLHAMGEEGTLQKAPQLWGLTDRLRDKFKNDSHFLRERSDIADILPDRITAAEKENLEVGEEGRKTMRGNIIEKAEELSREIEMGPIIEDEKNRLIKEGAVKPEEAPDLAKKNIAARYLHYTGLKSGDIKNLTKGSVESDIAARAFRDMTPQHIQAVQNNFKTETINKVMEKTFHKMFDGKTDEEAREILDDYYNGVTKDASGGRTIDPKLANKHARVVHWATNTPGGREMNLPIRKYMTDPDGKSTANIDAYERKQRIEEKLNANPALKAFYNEIKNENETIRKNNEAIENMEISVREAKRGKLEASVISALVSNIKDKKNDIEAKNDEIKRKIQGLETSLKKPWEEIEELKKHKQKTK